MKSVRRRDGNGHGSRERGAAGREVGGWRRGALQRVEEGGGGGRRPAEEGGLESGHGEREKEREPLLPPRGPRVLVMRDESGLGRFLVGEGFKFVTTRCEREVGV